MSGTTIEVKNLTKRIGGNTVLEEVSVRACAGKVTGFSGVNGSGKTMLMRAIAGLIRPTSGEVVIGGKTLWKDISFPESIGFLIENPAFIGTYTGLNNLKMIAAIQAKVGEDTLRHTIEKVGLDPDDKRKYRKYSLGMKQRLGIAAALMESPDIVLLDEPTNALDVAGVALLEALVEEERERGAVVVLSCHDKEILERLADTVYYFEQGRITKMMKGGVVEDV